MSAEPRARARCKRHVLHHQNRHPQPKPPGSQNPGGRYRLIGHVVGIANKSLELTRDHLSAEPAAESEATRSAGVGEMLKLARPKPSAGIDYANSLEGLALKLRVM